MRRRLVAEGYDRQAGLLGSLDIRTPPPSVATAPSGLPVLAHFDDAVARCENALPDDLAAAIAEFKTAVAWTQTAAYVRDPPSPAFLDQYAHATLAGAPDGSADVPARSPGVSLGLLLLGPDVHYPPHKHPADEVYLPLTEARWVHDNARWVHDNTERYRPEPVGRLLHHEPWQPHGMLTAGRPLLAIYVWTGDVCTPSRFC